jgi:predicted metal-binding protein
MIGVFIAAGMMVSSLSGAPTEKKTEEADERKVLTAYEQHRQLLEQMHAAEMRRLEEAEAMAKQREREDMIEEAKEAIEEARARHATALKQLEAREKQAEGEAEKK